MDEQEFEQCRAKVNVFVLHGGERKKVFKRSLARTQLMERFIKTHAWDDEEMEWNLRRLWRPGPIWESPSIEEYPGIRFSRPRQGHDEEDQMIQQHVTAEPAMCQRAADSSWISSPETKSLISSSLYVQSYVSVRPSKNISASSHWSESEVVWVASLPPAS